MTRLEILQSEVEALYAKKLKSRDAWSDWLYPNHVVVVASNAMKLAQSKGANIELSQAAALLHDIADYKMARIDENHEKESLKTARLLMQEAKYSIEDIATVVDDAIRYHSCHGDQRPLSKEGLVLAVSQDTLLVNAFIV